MEHSKKNMNTALNGYLFMLVCSGLAYMGSKVQLIDKISMGIDWTGAHVYQYNPVMYCIGFFLYWGLLILLYSTVFVKGLKELTKLPVGWKVVSFVLCLFQAVIMFWILNAIIYQTDYAAIAPSARFYVTVIGWPILTLIFPGIHLIRKSKVEGSVDSDTEENIVSDADYKL